MSFSQRLRLTAQSSIKCQYVRFENQLPSSDGITLDIVGNDLRTIRFAVCKPVETPTTESSDSYHDDFIWIA